MNPNAGRILWMWLKRDIKSRYAGSLVGMAWAVLGPMATILLFFVLFSFIFKARVPELASDAGYFYYLLAGLLPWLAFSDGLTRAVGSIVAHEQFLQKQVFTVAILPASAVLSSLLVQIVGTLFLMGFLFAAGLAHPVRWLLWPVVFLLQVGMTLGLALSLAVIAVHLRDLQHAIPVLLQFLMYATPILYSLSMVPEGYRSLFLLNPFACLVLAYHSIFLGTPMAMTSVIALLAWCIVLGGGGTLLFKILRPTLGEAL